MEWTTFKGKTVSLKTIDHQHLSNCYWYLKILLRATKEQLQPLVEESKDRFNGQILPYRPHVEFKQEIEMLGAKGLIRRLKLGKYEIVYHGEIIGEISIPYGEEGEIPFLA